MSVKFLIFVFLLMYEGNTSMVLKQHNGVSIPESNKLQIHFSQNEGPVHIRTENEILKVKAGKGEFIINGDPPSEGPFNPKQELKKKLIHEPEPDDLHNPSHTHVVYPDDVTFRSNPHYSYYVGKEDPSKPDTPDYVAYPFDSTKPKNPLETVIDTIENMIYGFQGRNDKRKDEAKKNLDLLETDLETALHNSKMVNQIAINPSTVEVIVSYLEHLQYLHDMEHGKKVVDVPELPDKFRPLEPITEDPDDALIEEQRIADKINNYRKAISFLNKQIESMEGTQVYSHKITEFIGKKKRFKKNIELLQMGLEEKEEIIEGELEDLLQKEELSLKKDKSTKDQELADKKHEEIEIIIEEDETSSHIIDLETQALNDEIIKIDQQVLPSSEEDLEEVENEKAELEHKELELIEEGDQKRIEKLDSEIESILEQESILSGQENTVNQLKELEIGKAELIARKEEIKHALDQPDDEILQSLKDEIEGHEHEIGDSIHYQGHKKTDSSEIYEFPESESNELSNEDHSHEDPLDEPLDIKFASIEDYTQLDYLKQQLNLLSSVYDHIFHQLPLSEEELPSDPTNVRKGLTIYDRLKEVNRIFDQRNKAIEDELIFLKDKLTAIGDRENDMLAFYMLLETVKKIRKRKKHVRILETLKGFTNIDNELIEFNDLLNGFIKDTNTMITLHELVGAELGCIADSEVEDGFDDNKKVECALPSARKLMALRKEIDVTIEEMKFRVVSLAEKRADLTGDVDTIGEVTLDSDSDSFEDRRLASVYIINTFTLISLALI